MKIVVINGTPLHGITYHMKEMFLRHFGEGHEIAEFYPDALPPFCTGCKACFLRGEQNCPHQALVSPIWKKLLEADLLVFAYPVYALRVPGSIKSLLDHLCVHWTVHRPEPAMFAKTAVILTNSVGAPNGSAQRDVKTSLQWMGVSKIHTCGAGMMGDIFWNTISRKHQAMLERKTARLARRVLSVKARKRKSLRVWAYFTASKFIHRMNLKAEAMPSLDNQHYIDQGWIKPGKSRP